MGQPVRTCSTPALALLFGNRSITQLPKLARADLFTFVLADGTTTYRWTSWDSDITVGGHTFSSRSPWLVRSRWSVTKTMVVNEHTVKLLALNDNFDGGADIKTQIRNGLFRKASYLLQELYMPTPGDVTTLGTMDIFSGQVGPVLISGATATLTIRGLNTVLDQYGPRNVFQAGCLHSFCDVNCTLSRATFTTSFTVGSSPAPTTSFIPWASAPGTPSLYIGGEVTMTSGADDGHSCDIVNADSSGIYLDSPLSTAPSAGDTFSAFQGCDYTQNSGSGRSCTDRSNLQNFLGFPYLPPPSTAY